MPACLLEHPVEVTSPPRCWWCCGWKWGQQANAPSAQPATHTLCLRCAQIAGHGNFGSIDDDPAAAMRYTECRLRALTSQALLADLEADTVDFVPTFDASQVR